MTDHYPVEKLDDRSEFSHCDPCYHDDDGTMPENVAELRKHVVGHRIVAVENPGTVRVVEEPAWTGDKIRTRDGRGLVITLDNGEKVLLEDTGDCCAYTQIEAFLLHPELIDHVITGVGTTEHYEKWHIYADLGDVLELTVGWSCGNSFYYGYGFDIYVTPLEGEVVEERPAIEA